MWKQKISKAKQSNTETIRLLNISSDKLNKGKQLCLLNEIVFNSLVYMLKVSNTRNVKYIECKLNQEEQVLKCIKESSTFF